MDYDIRIFDTTKEEDITSILKEEWRKDTARTKIR
jgi:hypothetical protein